MIALVHIGMHKTGSTSIQQTLSRLPSLGDGHFYPRLGDRDNHSVAMHQMFASEPERHQLLRKQGMGRAEAAAIGRSLREDLDRQLRAQPHHVPVFSAEYLSSCAEDVLSGLKSFLVERGYQPSLKDYVRPAADYMRSDFQQRVKGGASDFSVAAGYPRYRRRFGRIERLFGQDISYWVFDPKTFVGGDVVSDFCARAGLPQPPAESIVRSNDSLSRDALALLYLYRQRVTRPSPSPQAFRESRAMIAAVRWIPGPKFSLSQALITPVLADNMEDLAWIEQRVGVDMRRTGDEAPDAVRSEAHLIELGEQALLTQVRRLGLEKVIRGPADIGVLMTALKTEVQHQRRTLGSQVLPEAT